LNLRRIALSLILAISLISGFSMAEDSNVSTDESDVQPGDVPEPTVAEDYDVETAAPEEAGDVDEAAVADAGALEGSWILNLDDAQISMVIYQSGDLLFGAANSETPKPWNGVVSGSADEDEVELEILSLQDGVLVSTMIHGIATEGTLAGSFVQSDSKGKVNEGKAMGFLTSPDTSGYEPAVVPEETTSAVVPATQAPVVQTDATTPAQETTTGDGKRTPVDVTTLADQYYAVGAGTTPI
jgi:hypothetical protein